MIEQTSKGILGLLGSSTSSGKKYRRLDRLRRQFRSGQRSFEELAAAAEREPQLHRRPAKQLLPVDSELFRQWTLTRLRQCS